LLLTVALGRACAVEGLYHAHTLQRVSRQRRVKKSTALKRNPRPSTPCFLLPLVSWKVSSAVSPSHFWLLGTVTVTVFVVTLFEPSVQTTVIV
jgi:hypothetical protein